jgi:hypothetical protein
MRFAYIMDWEAARSVADVTGQRQLELALASEAGGCVVPATLPDL